MTNEVRTTSATGGQKGVKDERFDLIPAGALAKLARHYGAGARKYDDNQWRKGYEWSKSYAAMQRHLNQFWGGEDVDEETGSSHLACAAWHCFALMTFAEEFPEYDDRYDPDAAEPVSKERQSTLDYIPDPVHPSLFEPMHFIDSGQWTD